MRSTAVTLALALSGCFYSQARSEQLHHDAYTVDAVAAGLGVVLAFIPTGDGDQIAERKLVAAGALLGFGIIGFALNSAAATPSGPDAALQAQAARAEAAADQGDCAGAKAAMLPIFERDRAYFDSVMSSQPALAGCMK